ncbi:SOUL family heme-binding protein [Mycolicibacterium thermoresistibile]
MLDVKKVVTQGLEFLGSVVGVRWGTEEPAYTVLEALRHDGATIEIRRYAQRVAAETTVRADEDTARTIGFRRLAGYIFGDNSGSTEIDMTAPVTQRTGRKIAMTAPVAQRGADAPTESTIRFFMPAQWSLDRLPRPNDDRIELVSVPGETVAVLQFSGDRGPAEVRRRTDRLQRAVAGSRYRPAGDPVAWFYDPPFTLPFRRRNEVVLPVSGEPVT